MQRITIETFLTPRTLCAICTLCCVATLTGCVTVHTYDNEPQLPTTFSSGKAAQVFYDSAFVRKTKHNGDVIFHLPLQIRRGFKTPTTRFNDAVRSADSNTDGRISLTEARAYEESVAQPGESTAD